MFSSLKKLKVLQAIGTEHETKALNEYAPLKYPRTNHWNQEQQFCFSLGMNLLKMTSLAHTLYFTTTTKKDVNLHEILRKFKV